MSARTRFHPDADPKCYDPRMTRAQALAMRAAGTLRENCHVVVIDAPVIGADGITSPTEIELHPTSPTSYGLEARVFALAFDNSSWDGQYDIDLGVNGSIIELKDNRGNHVKDIDADSPTVHTQFPWGNLQWRDNYAEDTTFTRPNLSVLAPSQVVDSSFTNTTMDFTGWTTGSIIDTHVKGPGLHKVINTSNWSRSRIENSNVNALSANINLSGADILDLTTNVVTQTGIGTISITNSRIEDSAVVFNQGDRNMTITNSNLRNQGKLINDPGSQKAFSLQGATISGSALIRGQAGTVLRPIVITDTVIQGSISAADTITIRDDAGISLTLCDIYNSRNPWVIDGKLGNMLSWTRTIWRDGVLVTGPNTKSWLSNICEFNEVNAFILGTGNLGTVVLFTETSDITNAQLSIAAGTAATLSIHQTYAMGSIPGSAFIKMDNNTVRRMIIDGGCVLTGNFGINQSSTVAPANNTLGDRVYNCTLQDGVINFQTAAGGAQPHQISTCLIVGGPNVNPLGFPDGQIDIDGTSAWIVIYASEIWGYMHITDAPQGALNDQSSLQDNYIGSGSALTYIGGDNLGGVPKLIKHNRIEGLSELNCTNLTGSAGAGLADVFACRVANQSILNVNGARVPGFPVRNAVVENNAILTVDPNGSVLQMIVANTAQVATGPFVHLYNEISGNFVRTLTAQNINNLQNKAYNDIV